MFLIKGSQSVCDGGIGQSINFQKSSMSFSPRVELVAQDDLHAVYLDYESSWSKEKRSLPNGLGSGVAQVVSIMAESVVLSSQ